jgi:predicted Zn-dependent protease
MARRGELEAARQLVENLLVESENSGAPAWELAVRLRLASGDAAGARRALERLEASDAEAPVLSLLRCRLRLHAGELDSAEDELAGVRARLHPEAYLLRGRILEARGQVEEAAALYRERLERAVFSSE